MPGEQEPGLVAADGPSQGHAQATGRITPALMTARDHRCFGHGWKVFASTVRAGVLQIISQRKVPNVQRHRAAVGRRTQTLPHATYGFGQDPNIAASVVSAQTFR